MQILDNHRLLAAKAAYSTRRIDLKEARTLITDGLQPAAGDLLLARVDRTGHHDGVELTTGRRATLYAGDEVLLCYGNRYAPDQFEAIVPSDLGPCHMVAAGGLAARALSWHTAMRSPTDITPLGIVADREGEPLNVRQYRVPSIASELKIPVILSVGTSMNSGKTTTAAMIVHALARAGYEVGAAKITGTSAGKDTWLMRDSGASHVLDFNDAGFVTTFMVPSCEVESGAMRLLRTLQSKGSEVIVVEVADGLLQKETRELLERPTFKHFVSSVFFSAVDSMGSVSGAKWLQEIGYHLPALAGVMTNSPLARREAAESTGLPVKTLAELRDPATVTGLLPQLRQVADGRRRMQEADRVALSA